MAAPARGQNGGLRYHGSGHEHRVADLRRFFALIRHFKIASDNGPYTDHVLPSNHYAAQKHYLVPPLCDSGAACMRWDRTWPTCPALCTSHGLPDEGVGHSALEYLPGQVASVRIAIQKSIGRSAEPMGPIKLLFRQGMAQGLKNTVPLIPSSYFCSCPTNIAGLNGRRSIGFSRPF